MTLLRLRELQRSSFYRASGHILDVFIFQTDRGACGTVYIPSTLCHLCIFLGSITWQAAPTTIRSRHLLYPGLVCGRGAPRDIEPGRRHHDHHALVLYCLFRIRLHIEAEIYLTERLTHCSTTDLQNLSA